MYSALSKKLLIIQLAVISLGGILPVEASTSSPLLVRFDDLLWRGVQDPQGNELGGISDLLVQMPSGRVVFIAVDPSALFERARAVAPAALRLPERRDAPLVLDISKDRWINAPLLDWNAALVIKNTEEGQRIYGYYHQAWVEPDPTPPWGLRVSAAPAGAAPAVRYVSLKELLLNRVETNGRQQAGYIRGFLIDWSAKRATHALVSPQFTPLVRPDAMWFAVPVALLNPPVHDDAIIINSSLDAFRRAPDWPGAGNTSSGDVTTIYRYPALEDPREPGNTQRR